VIHPKFFQDSGNCLLLDAIEGRWIKDWKTTHKFGICLLKTAKEALEIDRFTNTDFWRKAVNKEMAKVKITWATHDGNPATGAGR
jgi:hypothetical protein